MERNEIELEQLEFVDDFNGTVLNPIWGCEYQCPSISNGYARFNLKANVEPNQNSTWSKIYYKPKTLSFGIYSMRFRYNRRPPYPAEGELWAGLALWDNNAPDGFPNEVNFGIDTACVQRCNDQTLILESYKNGKNTEIICNTGINLFDGNWHIGILTYMETKITLNVDGKDVGSIADTSEIPTVPMTFVPGTRLINGKLSSGFNFDIDRITITDGTTPVIYSIKVTSPLAGVTYRAGDSRIIRWTSTDNVGTTVKVQLLRSGNVVKTISNGTANDGSFSWIVPSVQRSSSYQIKITSMTNSSCSGTSGKFTIR